MKSKIMFGLATLATLALPALAEDGSRFRRDDDRRTVYIQNYDRDHDTYMRRYDGDDSYVAHVDRDRRDDRDRRQARIIIEHRDRDRR